MVVFVFALKLNFFFDVNIPVSINNLEIIAITINGTIVVNAYNPLSNLIGIEDLPFVNDFTNVIICGNFNAHHKMWDDGTLNTND